MGEIPSRLYDSAGIRTTRQSSSISTDCVITLLAEFTIRERSFIMVLVHYRYLYVIKMVNNMPTDLTERHAFSQHADGRLSCEIKDECEPAEFVQVSSELSDCFAHASMDSIDLELERSLKTIAKYARADRAALWEFAEADAEVDHTYEYFQNGFAPYSRKVLLDGFRWGREQLKHGTILTYPSLSTLPPEASADRAVFECNRHSVATGVPLTIGGKVVGALCLYGKDPAVASRLPRWRIFGNILANTMVRRLQNCAISALDGLIEQDAESGSFHLQEEEAWQHEETLLGKSECFKRVLRLIDKLSKVDATVLITGETGTGKELVANAIHRLSDRRSGPFIKLNCAALPQSLAESELFGHDAGAFTGAGRQQIGRFEAADKGTLFLDEVGELPLDLQAKLLRVLQEGEFERLGSVTTQKVDVRVIAATNSDLPKAIQEMRFRRDLYYRLNVVPLNCPALRERTDDLPLLVNHFVNQFNRKFGKSITSISQSAMSAIHAYTWPGNIRELRNVIERAVLLSSKMNLGLYDIFSDDSTPVSESGILPLGEQQHDYILKILHKTNWRVSGHWGAAALLAINPKTLESRMKKLGIVRPTMRSRS